jgi:hypothetical protein
MKKVFLALAAAAMLFVGCSKDDDKESLSDKIQGKWMISEVEGEALPTNMKIVFTFGENSRGYQSLSSGIMNLWMPKSEFTYTINGEELTMVMDEETEEQPNLNMKIKSINGNTMVWVATVPDIIERKDRTEEVEMEFKLTRVTKDYSADILGMWQGQVTSEMGSEFDDGEEHRWEYLTDGTFHFFRKVDGNWQLSDDEFAQYFVDGTLLCTRWKNTGENTIEHREWWEISSIENNTMTWTALRDRGDGTAYTATFQMERVPANED